MWKARQDLVASNPDDPSLKFADPSTILCQNPEAVWDQIEAARNSGESETEIIEHVTDPQDKVNTETSGSLFENI